MPIEFDLPHAQARAYLHTGRRALSGGEAKQLDAHLAGCAACRAYAAHLAQAEPALTAALRAQWDPAQPPQSDRAFAAAVRARLTRPSRALPNWFSGAGVTLAVGMALLVLVVVWISSGWGVSTGGPQPTEVVIETIPHQATTAPLFEGLSGEILFSGTSEPAAGAQWGIYALPPEGGPLTALTPYAQQTYGGVWSPDGQWIAFIGREFCCTEIFVMRADGSDLHRVSPASDTNWEYLQPISWSPDGQTLAVGRMQPGDRGISTVNGEIILIPLDGSGARPFGPGLSPNWSPDGSRLAYLRPDNAGMTLFTSHPDGTDERQASALHLTPYSAFDWSPDGTQLALIGISTLSSPPELRVVWPNGEYGEQWLAGLGAVPNSSEHLHWSPDGEALLFDANMLDGRGQPRENAGLYIYAFKTLEIYQALPDVSGDFSWSPNGQRLVATDAAGANLYEFELSAEGEPVLVESVPAPDANVANPQWRSDPAITALVQAPPETSLPANLLNRWVAFLVRNAANQDEVYLLRENPHTLSAINSTGRELAWSPDGTRLAFVSDQSGLPQVYLFDPEYWQITPLTFADAAQPALDFSLDWSPDGNWLAVTTAPMERGPDWNGGELYLLDVHRSGVERFPADAPRLAQHVTERAVWSPDGQWLAYGVLDDNGLPALYALNVAAAQAGDVSDTTLKRLTAATDPTSGQHDIYLGFAWSPDSRHVALLRQGPWVGEVFNAQPGPDFRSRIELVGLEMEPGGWPVGLADFMPSPNGIMGLSWSPDGAYVLYLSDAVSGTSLGSGTASTGCWTPRLLPVTTELPIQASGPAVALDGVCYLTRTALPQWSPDSHYLLFSAEAGPVVVNVPQALADGGHGQPLFLPLPADLPGRAHSPAWQPKP